MPQPLLQVILGDQECIQRPLECLRGNRRITKTVAGRRRWSVRAHYPPPRPEAGGASGKAGDSEVARRAPSCPRAAESPPCPMRKSGEGLRCIGRHKRPGQSRQGWPIQLQAAYNSWAVIEDSCICADDCLPQCECGVVQQEKVTNNTKNGSRSFRACATCIFCLGGIENYNDAGEDADKVE